MNQPCRLHPHLPSLILRSKVPAALLLFTLLLTGSARADAPDTSSTLSSKVDSAVTAAVQWLEKQQANDGRWPSETYGSLKSGIGTTALILEALSEVRPAKSSSAEAAFLRGQKVLTSNMKLSGVMHSPDGRSDSPVYASALLLTASTRFRPLPEKEHGLLQRVLHQAQQIPRQSWPENAVGRGGWGIETDPATAESNPANMSVTAHALTALNLTDGLSAEPRKEAMAFLNRCRNPDFQPNGGFWFLPRRDDQLNKLGFSVDAQGEPQPRAYSTATCDGIIALLQLGKSVSDPDVVQALEFLLRQDPVAVPRMPENPDDPVPPLAGLYFYHAAALGSVWEQTGDLRLQPRIKQIHNELLALQKEDGRWESPIAIMREDDPLIATGLAIIALKRFQSEPKTADSR